MRGEKPSPLKIHYVDVDTKAIQVFGNFPWNREIFGIALNSLFTRGKVQAIGMDFVFSSAGIPGIGQEEAKAGTLALGRAVRDHGNVVLAATYRGASEGFPLVYAGVQKTDGFPELPEFPIVGPTWGHVGLIDTLGEDARFQPIFARSRDHTYFNLGFELALIHWGVDPASVEITRDALVIPGRKPIPLVLGQMIEPNWFSPWDSAQNPRSSISEVLAWEELANTGSDEEKARASEFFRQFEGAIVLIGPTDPLLKDVSLLPMDGDESVPRVSVYGNMLKTLVSGDFLWRFPAWGNAVLITVLAFAGMGFALVRPAWVRVAKIGALVVLGGYVFGVFAVFALWGLVIPLVAGTGACLSAVFAGAVVQLSSEQRQRRRIKELFGTYVSSAVVDEMVERHVPPQTGGSEVEITAFFSDVVAFSTIAESLPPRDLVDLMCEYFAEGTDAVMNEGGTLDKYVGDAIVAIFGAPLQCATHAVAACRAAVGLQAGNARLRAMWAAGSRWPVQVHGLRSRVGLHTGPAIVGNIGSPRRFNYTMMGDTVNLAQRLEAAAGHYGAGILVSQETHDAASAADPALVFRPLDRVYVPGRVQAVELFELISSDGTVPACLEAYAAAREIYRRGDWAAAGEAFEKAASLEAAAAKNPSLIMAKRCAGFAGRPPAEDLVFSLVK